ncbi:MAG: hypothetical protein HOC18_05100 [Candidatus Marinimicrobia bacterium]|nr:hypothetical protein [Candidatus Neomarinimicrobiota bacterium]
MKILIYTLFPFLIFVGCDEPEEKENEKPVHYFSKVFGEFDAEMGYSIHETQDGGFIISGATSSYWATDSLPKIAMPQHGVTNAIVVKIDSIGEQEWVKTFGGELFESAFNAKETSDGGDFFAGYTNSFGKGLYDFWLVKLNEGGQQTWEKTYGTAKANVGLYGDITSDGGFILTGYTIPAEKTDKDVWLLKTNSNGDSLWSVTFDDSMNQSANYLQETNDGGFILVGETRGQNTNLDILIIKTDADGIMLWTNTLIESNSDQAFSIKETGDGYILIGTTTSLGMGDKDIWLNKLDESGNVVWQKTYGGEALEYGFDVVPVSDGYVFTGSTSSYGTMFYDLWVIKVDLNGEDVWNQIYGGTMIDIGRSIIKNASGGFTILGQTSSYGAGEYDFWIIKTDKNGIIPSNEP